MQTRNLGRTGLPVTQLGFGALEVRGPRVWGGRAVSAAQADRILNAVLDSGINFVDTSYDYGMSEEYIGRFLSHRRSEYILATKCGCYLTPPVRTTSSRTCGRARTCCTTSKPACGA